MKYGLIAVLAMAVAGLATAQTPLIPGPPTVGGVPAGATTTEATTTPTNERYTANPELLARCQARVAAFRSSPCDLIFIGDSITENWLDQGRELWTKLYVPLHALNFGIGGDRTQDVLWRLANLDLSDLKPKVAVIMIGTNNLGDNPHAIADGVKMVVSNTEEIFPGVKVILVSILPNARANDKMMQVDGLIRNLADDQTVFYLDLIPLMPPTTTTSPDGTPLTNWKGLGSDALHPDAEGYKIWADAMAPLLQKLLAGG